MKEVAADDLPATDDSVNDAPVKNGAVKDVTIKDVAAKDIASKDVTVKDVAIKYVTVKEHTPTEDMSAKELATNDVIMNDEATEGTTEKDNIHDDSSKEHKFMPNLIDHTIHHDHTSGAPTKPEQIVECQEGSRTRPAISIDQKKKILDEYDRRKREGTSSTQKDLAAWASHHLSIPTPSQSAISKMLKSRHDIQSTNCLPATKRMSGVTCSRLERALVAWINDCTARKEATTDRLIQEKADRIVRLVNQKLPPTQTLALKFSHGWLHKFKKRHGFKKWTRHAETISPPPTNVLHSAIQDDQQALTKLTALVSQYRPRDVFSAQEFALRYSMPPDSAITLQQQTHRNASRARLTCVTCCNADASERLPLMIIGTCKSPASFRGQLPDDLGFDYHHNTRAWMTSELFFDWLEKFDRRIGNELNRKVCLLLNYSPVHGRQDTLPKLNYTQLAFVPITPIGMTQPLDNGIITALKCRYRRRQLEQALDLLDIGLDSIYAVDQLHAMRWIEQEWQKLPQILLQTAWQRSKLIHLGLPDGHDASDVEREDIKVLEDLMHKLVPETRRMSVLVLLNHEDEKITTGQLTDELLAEEVLEERMQMVDDDQPPEDEPALPPLRKQAQAVALVKLMFSRRGMSCDTTNHRLNELHSIIRQEEADH